jgi:chromate transporter
MSSTTRTQTSESTTTRSAPEVTPTEHPVTSPGEGSKARRGPSLAELGTFSLWMGVIGFGGGLSVLATLHATAVERRGWLTEREFDNTATVSQMLPGGAAANALALIGLRFFGAVGAAMAYGGFILPGFACILVLAHFYSRIVGLPHAGALLGGLNAAVVGIVSAITLKMVRTSVGRFWQMGVAAMALVMSLGGGASAGEAALVGIGLGLVLDLGMKRVRLARSRRTTRRTSPAVSLPDEGEPLRKADSSELHAFALPALASAGLALAASGGLLSLVLLFLRTGLGAYGGGFAIVPHLQATLVATGVLTERQFADAVALGKMTPGPVLLMATFIGYVKEGIAGAIASTLAIFAAPFVLTVGLGGWLARYRSRRVVRAALRGLTPSVLGTMAAAAATLGASLEDPAEIAIAVAVALTLSRFRVNPALMLLVGGVARLLLSWTGR